MTGSWSNLGVDLLLQLDPDSGRRVGLEQALREAIRSGRLAPQALLPPTRKLADELGMSRGTVKAAYDQLIAEGFLSARQGSGTIVAHVPPSPPSPPSSQEPSTVADPITDELTKRQPRYDLRPGSPDVSTFPVATWLRSTRHALNAAPMSAFDYGDPRGRLELRQALAEYLGRARGVVTRPEQIVITSGSIQSLALLSRVLSGGASGPGGGSRSSHTNAANRTGRISRSINTQAILAMEDPGLPFHRDVVRRNGCTVVPLPVDELGASITGVKAAAAVVTPAHQYPTGVTLHPTRRRALLDWARTTGALIIEDDYDGEFRYDRQPTGALQGSDPEHVAYLGTASKTLGPALRLGWMALPSHLVEPIREAKRHADHQTESIGQLTLADMIVTHAYDRHVRACRLRYQHRRDLLLEKLGVSLGTDFTGPSARYSVKGIAAGLHALIDLSPGTVSEEAVQRRAAAYGLAVGRLADHWHEGDGGGGDGGSGDGGSGRKQGLIVGYGTPSERVYPAALDALAYVLGT